MVDSILNSIGELFAMIITEYAPILLDLNTLMAVGLACILTHLVKQSDTFREWGVEPGQKRRQETVNKQIRWIAIIFTGICLAFFKRNDGELDKLLNVIVFMSFASPYIYKGIIHLIRWKCPKLAEILSAK